MVDAFALVRIFRASCWRALSAFSRLAFSLRSSCGRLGSRFGCFCWQWTRPAWTNQRTQNIMHITKIMPKLALAALATSTLATSAFASDASLITAVESAVTAAGTGLGTVLVAVIAVVATFILFKLIKRGANKV